MPIQLKNSRVSVTGLSSVSESNLPNSGVVAGGGGGGPGGGGSGAAVAVAAAGAGAGAVTVGSGSIGVAASAAPRNSKVANTAALFENNSADSNSTGESFLSSVLNRVGPFSRYGRRCVIFRCFFLRLVVTTSSLAYEPRQKCTVEREVRRRRRRNRQQRRRRRRRRSERSNSRLFPQRQRETETEWFRCVFRPLQSIPAQ